MPNQPNQQPNQQPISLRFPRDEWELLVTLPRRVLITASVTSAVGPAATPAGVEPAVGPGLAGLAAIAGGHDSPSPLIREVVAAIYTEALHEDPGPSGRASEHAADPSASVVQTLAAGERATQVLAERADPGDSAAYRQWLGDIAGAVCGAVDGGSRGGRSSSQVRLAGNEFVDALRLTLRG